MAEGIATKIEQLLEVKFTEEEYSDCFLIEIAHHKNNKVEVFIDSDSGISFKTCQRISRYLEQYFDEEQWLGEKYILDVSSPGVDRPLKLTRQYIKNVGRNLEVTDQEGARQKGTLVAADEDKIVIEYIEKYKEGKKNKKRTVQKEYTYDTIQQAVVKVSFK
jgi:ribosome maturation factor RimP